MVTAALRYSEYSNLSDVLLDITLDFDSHVLDLTLAQIGCALPTGFIISEYTVSFDLDASVPAARSLWFSRRESSIRASVEPESSWTNGALIAGITLIAVFW
jgi:hypothetical protein